MKVRRASIDLGSNSCLLLAGELDKGRFVSTLANESRVTGLGRELDKNGSFLDIAMDETFSALEEYCEICDSLEIPAAEIIATATEASRVAANAGKFFETVKTKLGIDFQIITAEAEAYYSAKGITAGENSSEPLAIMDIGGASTEFIFTDEVGNILNSFSVPIGSVRVTNWSEDGVLEEKLAEIRRTWSERLSSTRATTLTCVAGTMTSLANMHLGLKSFEEEEVHGHILRKEEVVKMEREFSSFDPADFLERFPFLGKRSYAIKGGLVLVKNLGELMPSVQEYKISTYGLRYGTLFEGGVQSGYIFNRGS